MSYINTPFAELMHDWQSFCDVKALDAIGPIRVDQERWSIACEAQILAKSFLPQTPEEEKFLAEANNYYKQMYYKYAK
jgi:hypothetical protein